MGSPMESPEDELDLLPVPANELKPEPKLEPKDLLKPEHEPVLGRALAGAVKPPKRGTPETGGIQEHLSIILS